MARRIIPKVLDQQVSPSWALYHGDCCEVIKGIPDDSLHYSIFSPPFESLFTFSSSERDLGNCRSTQDFQDHFKFLAAELFRVIKPGRLISLHCINLPTTKTRDGFIGIRDFRGDLIRLLQAVGFYFHSEVCIWKDPIVAMQRTKAIGLLHGQMKKDSSISRMGIPDYVITLRKPGENEEKIEGLFTEYYGTNPPTDAGDDLGNSINIWSRYASPVWDDINPSDTLQYRSARENNDERHVTPTQLTVIRRCLQLWTNPGDVVLDPFNGIGSTGFCCLEMDRRYVGFELKKSYYDAAVKNLANASTNQQQSLFDVMGVA